LHLLLGAAIFVAALAASALAAAPGTAETAAKAGADENVCLDPVIREQRGLKCPDLRMRPPFQLDREKNGNTPVLRAANSIDSVGDGPAELQGRRSGPRTMKADQRVKKEGGDRARFETKAKLYFKNIPGQGRYWKFRDAARFALWQLDDNGDRVRRVEVGPKQVYCLRDLEHTRPGMNGSPPSAVYPACNQSAGRERVTLGTSVGWSDVYPSSYPEQFIELNDIPKRGCYAFVHVADPEDGIYELNEDNNAASTVVYLTPSGRYKPNRCSGVRDRALPPSQTTDDSQVGGGGGGYRAKREP
jgi:hypothetical protein